MEEEEQQQQQQQGTTGVVDNLFVDKKSFKRGTKEVHILQEQWNNSSLSEKRNLKKKDDGHDLQRDTVHGMMIDAGSHGSRLHIFEWDPRVLHSDSDVQSALGGKQFSIPREKSRWVKKVNPGISYFGKVVAASNNSSSSSSADELKSLLEDYLEPMLTFAKNVLHEKEESFEHFPIYLQATAGMRTLPETDRGLIMRGIRSVLSESPFYFIDEFANVISGEEEAVYAWVSVNLLAGTLLEDSKNVEQGLISHQTVGALDLGGASTQIAFYEPNGEIMSSSFKIQIGQGKQWKLYAHSFLYFGLDQAQNRLEAKFVEDYVNQNMPKEGVINPCLPWGASTQVESNIHFQNGAEIWQQESSNETFRNAVLISDDDGKTKYDRCSSLVRSLFHEDQNSWCKFSHHGACSFAGVYQPLLPRQKNRNSGEFLATSNYIKVWKHLKLPKRSSLAELKSHSEKVCAMDLKQVTDYTGKANIKICFEAIYVFQLLTTGYGFEMDDYITATDKIAGQNAEWTLGAMTFEINTLPWMYDPKYQRDYPTSAVGVQSSTLSVPGTQPAIILVALFVLLLGGFLWRFRHRQIRSSREAVFELVKQSASFESV